VSDVADVPDEIEPDGTMTHGGGPARADDEVAEALVPRHDVPKRGRSGFVLVDDRQVHYLEWGKPVDGGTPRPSVVALHGGGQTAYMFEELGAALADSYHVLAPDLPNHGDSDSMPDEADTTGQLIPAMGPQSIANTIGPFLDEFGVHRAAFVGASLGGLTSIRLAESEPQRVGAIVLIDVGHRLEPEGVRKIIDFMSKHESFGTLEEAAEEISKYLPQRRNVRPESLSRNLRQRPDGRWVWKHSFGRRFREAAPENHPADNLDEFMSGVKEAS
jgi:pimeloyl-ACP methyl ester carboxylesterase